MGCGDMYANMVQKAFDFLDSDYDMIVFPVYQENSSQPSGDGHWFTIAVHMVDNEFQVIDSLRNSDNNELTLKAN